MDYRCILLAFMAIVGAENREIVERMIMVRKTGSDLDPEATGFIYKSEDKGPAKLIKLGEKEVHTHLDNMPKKYYSESHAYSSQNVKRKTETDKEPQLEELKDGDTAAVLVAPIVEYPDDEYLVYDRLSPGYYSEYDGPYYFENGYDYPYYEDYYGEGVPYYGNLGPHFGEYGPNFGYHGYGGKIEDGDRYDRDVFNDFGEDGLSGFEEAKRFNRDDHESFGASADGGNYKEGASEENALIDESDNFADDFSNSQSYQGGDKAHEKQFDKGVKITGFHKVYNKDDLQKVSDVYDESDRSGNFHKHQSGEGGHATSGGGYIQNGNEAAAVDEADFAEKSHVDVSRNSESDAGFKKESGSEGYDDQHKEFKVKGGAGERRNFEYEDYRI